MWMIQVKAKWTQIGIGCRIRGCGQDIVVTGQGVDSQQWHVNVDATLPNSVAIRTAALFERWQIIMGTLNRSPGTRSIILDPGAQYNWMEITPPLWNFDGYENNSNYPNNVFVQSPRPPSPWNNSTETFNTGIKKKKAKKGDYTQSHMILSLQPFNDGPGPNNMLNVTDDKVDTHQEKEDVDIKKRLTLLKQIYEEDLINEKEYQTKKTRNFGNNLRN